LNTFKSAVYAGVMTVAANEGATAVNVTYPEVGATLRGELPPGYSHLRVRVPVGGPEAFATAVWAVTTWRMHRAAGLFVEAERARPGLRITGRLNLLGGTPRLGFRVPCEVVDVVDEPGRGGFVYGTLPGHPERGEEAFVVEVADGQTWLTVTAFSRPALWFTRAAGPLVPLLQRGYAHRLAAALRRICADHTSRAAISTPSPSRMRSRPKSRA
jgi:uncharacterized protein (UPF0548 family)